MPATTGTCAIAHCAVNWSAMWAKVKRSYVAYWVAFQMRSMNCTAADIENKLHTVKHIFLKPSEKIYICTMSSVLHTRRAVLKRIPLKWGKASYFSTAQHEDWRKPICAVFHFRYNFKNRFPNFSQDRKLLFFFRVEKNRSKPWANSASLLSCTRKRGLYRSLLLA